MIGIYFMSSWHEKYKPMLAEKIRDKNKEPKKVAPKYGGNQPSYGGETKSKRNHSGLNISRVPGTGTKAGWDAAGEEMAPVAAPLSGNNRIQSREAVIDGWNPMNDVPTPVNHMDQAGVRDETDPFSDHELYEDEAYRGEQSLSVGTVKEQSREGMGEDIKNRNAPDLPADFDDQELVNEFGYQPVEGFDKISQIDYWVKIFGDRDVGRESVLGIYRDSISSITKRSNIYGLRLPDNVWCDLELESEEVRFGDLVVTVQLADRFGPISESEMTRFSVLISNLSEKTGRGFSFMAPIESAMEQANSIDAFVRYFDSVFIVNIKPKESAFFDGSVIDRCATQIGLEKSRQNYYIRNKPVGKRNVCLYSLANMSDTGEFDFGDINQQEIRGVTFFIKPPQIQSPGPVFAEMVDTAKAFASRVKGEVTTPGCDDLSTEVVDVIRSSIEEVALKMGQNGIQSGSEGAIKIF